jgi:hypothetical protein
MIGMTTGGTNHGFISYTPLKMIAGEVAQRTRSSRLSADGERKLRKSGVSERIRPIYPFARPLHPAPIATGGTEIGASRIVRGIDDARLVRARVGPAAERETNKRDQHQHHDGDPRQQPWAFLGNRWSLPAHADARNSLPLLRVHADGARPFLAFATNPSARSDLPA